MSEKVTDQNINVDGKTIGFGSVVRLNVKTLIWILGALYVALGYLYFDLRQTVNKSSSILDEEKKEFMQEVDSELERKIDAIKEDMSEMRENVAYIKGDIKLILDRQSRDNPVRQTDAEVTTVAPPGQ